ELQILAEHSARFANQSQAKIWALRVLSWIGSVVTLGALPRLAQLIAPKSDFTDSLSRYLLGNGPEVDKDKLKNFSMLFEKFQNLNTLLASENLTDGDKVRISSGLYSNGSTKDTMTPEAQTVFEQAFPVYQEINRLIFDLGTPKEISGQEIAHAIAENFKNIYGEGRKAAPGSTDPHFNINWETAITSDIFDQAEPKFPAACKVEVDMMLRSDFKLSIGNKSITRGELWEGTSTADEKATNTRRWILGAIQELTNNKGQQVAILRNFLSTCIGQATNADTRIAFMAHARDEHGSLDVTQPNSIFYGVTIDMHGSCHIENTASYSQCAFSPPDDPASVIYVPSNIRMTVAYESSLEDFINDRPPHAIEDQCTVSGRCLDVSAMM
ncbi:MAG: hypothetical protein LBD40_02585, partial [Puniceicoccales bacterium]|nr:hypothetical protein [Puniceicoccales bacterium]